MKPIHFGVFVSLLVASTVGALQKISRNGRYLYGEDGNRFYIKGVAYQEQGTIQTTDPNGFPEPTDFIDPLADPDACNRDLPFLKQLGVNAIRVYSVDSTLNHDLCMGALSSAGIYTIIDLSLPVNGSIDRSAPEWTTNLLNLYLNTIDAFLKYDNVLAFNVGNEIVTSANETIAAPYIKAAARDVKAYLKSKGSSALVGYASVDAPQSLKVPLANYLACGSDATSLDIYGLNNYEWCGDSSVNNGYLSTTTAFQNYPIPAYFSEYGCVTSPPRLWTEVAALYGPQLNPVWSGGLAFSYFPAFGGYGIVNISSDGRTVTTTDDFTRLVTALNNVTFDNTPTKANAPTTSPAACPSADGVNFFASSTLPPTPDQAICDCYTRNAFSCLFSPQTPNTSVLIGQLLDYVCSAVGQFGSNCDQIGGNGSTGQYGALSYCDPPTKVSYAFSNYYEAQNRDPRACDFAGNATINTSPSAPSSLSAAQAAGSACSASAPAGGTFVPSTHGGSSPTSLPAPGSTGNSNGAMSVSPWVSIGLSVALTLVGGIWTLA